MELRAEARRLAVRGGLLLALVVAAAVVVNVSWFDEPLHPDIERVTVPRVVSLTDNAYPLIYGFPAADDRDPRAAGVAIVEALRERYVQGRPITLSAEEMAEILGGSGELDAAWQAGFESLPCNARVSLECADRVLDEIGRRGATHPRLDVLLERYERVLAAPRFEESQALDVTTPTPGYGLLMTVGRIRLAVSYHEDTVDAFIANVAEDIEFWRMMLRDGESLISKMVALAGLRNGLELLSASMRRQNLDAGRLSEIRMLLRPLTTEERDIGEAFLSELRVAVLSGKVVALAPSEPSWAMRLLLQEQATLNEHYLTVVAPVRLRAALDARSFHTERGYEPLTYHLRVFPPPFYNLGGKLLLKQQAQHFNVQDYISRVHDLDGRIALVRLQAEIEGSSGTRVETVVRESAHRNPYTGEPMDYESERGTIGFACLADNLNDVCAIALGPRESAGVSEPAESGASSRF